jgi:hypothetical protein
MLWWGKQMASAQAGVIGRAIYEASTPVLEISGIGGRPWKRNVAASDSGHGPWFPPSGACSTKKFGAGDCPAYI